LSLERFYSRSGHLIRRLHQISTALFFDEAGSLGLTPVQYAALNMIEEIPGIDQASLSNMIAFDKTTMVKVLDRLAEKRLITRVKSPDDRRSNRLNVTPRGTAVLKDIQPLLDRNDLRILAPLSTKDQQKFMEMLTRLVHVNNAYSRAPLDNVLRDDLMAKRKSRKTRKPARKRIAAP
jgi:DNA-binding MarR family transcriptional regulator